MEENLPEGLTVFVLPDSHRKMMRTTNFISTKNLQKKGCLIRKLVSGYALCRLSKRSNETPASTCGF